MTNVEIIYTYTQPILKVNKVDIDSVYIYMFDAINAFYLVILFSFL